MSFINIGLSDTQLKDSITILNRILADEFVLYTKVRKAHWNVSGINFRDLHKLYQSMYEDLDDIIDEVAERVRTLGGYAIGTLAEYVNISRLEENPGEYFKTMEDIKKILDLYETIIRELRTDIETLQNDIQDAGSADFLTNVMEKHEKTAWMVRSLLN